MDYQLKLINGKIKLIPIFKRMKIVDELFNNQNEKKQKPKTRRN